MKGMEYIRMQEIKMKGMYRMQEIRMEGMEEIRMREIKMEGMDRVQEIRVECTRCQSTDGKRNAADGQTGAVWAGALTLHHM